MPTVHVNVWEGFGEERVKTVIQNITKVFVDLGVPAHAVEIIVHEIPKSLNLPSFFFIEHLDYFLNKQSKNQLNAWSVHLGDSSLFKSLYYVVSKLRFHNGRNLSFLKGESGFLETCFYAVLMGIVIF